MKTRGSLARLALAGVALALSACAALPWPSGPKRETGVPVGGEWIDLRGVVHVHTRVSHDSPGAIGAIIDAAHGAGVAWVAFSEHTREATLLSARGEVEGVVLIPGWEISLREGSLLALGIADPAGLPRDPRELVQEIHARGGAAFVGHLERSGLGDPKEFEQAGPDGIEISNLHANAAEVPVRLALGAVFLPTPLAQRPLLRTPNANLERWAQLPGARAIVGGVDAHAKFRVLGPAGGTLDRYRDLFRLVTTHVLVRERSAPAILEALRAGRSYVAFEGLATVDRFEVSRETEGVRVIAPREARLALVCGGEVVSETEAREAVLNSDGDTVRCHVEAWLGSKLWVVTSQLGF
jgi:hypothetical protein